MNVIPKSRKRIVISTDLCGTYSFFTPITSYLWDKVTGYMPIVFVCGKMNKELEFATNFTKSLGFEVFHINSINGYTDQNVSQVSRLFAACLPVSPDSYIMTGDIDMWPLSNSYFNQQDLNKQVHLFGANTSNHTKYPICYIGMFASAWRSIMGLNLSKSIESNIEEQLDSFLGKDPSSDDGWYFDEKFFATKIKSWHSYPGGCHMINRGFAPSGVMEGRVDRSQWNFNGATNGMIDSHILRPGYYEENWPRLRTMLEALLTKDEVAMFDDYKDKWSKL